MYIPNELDIVYEELLQFKSALPNTIVENSLEALWLQKVAQPYWDSIEYLIVISDRVWHIPRGIPYAEFIGINMHFSMFSVPPLLSVITHEYSQRTSFFYENIFQGPDEEPHIDKEHTKKSWEEMSAIPYKKELLNNQERINELYQENNAYSILNLAILLKIINN